jgi:ribosomal protein L40E
MNKFGSYYYDGNGDKITQFIAIPNEKGICIRCAAQLEYLDGGKPLCKRCYAVWAWHNNSIFKRNSAIGAKTK